LTSDIHIVRLCKAHDSLINATYLINALIDITLSTKVTLNSFSKHKFYLPRSTAHSCHKFSVGPQPFAYNELYCLLHKWSIIIIHQSFPRPFRCSIYWEDNESLRFPVLFSSVDIPFRMSFIQL